MTLTSAGSKLNQHPSESQQWNHLGSPFQIFRSVQLPCNSWGAQDGTIVTIARATVSAVEELEEKQVFSGATCQQSLRHFGGFENTRCAKARESL